MHFTSGINRPPYEQRSGFLQVTSGCSHASCAFCAYFKDSRFIKSDLDEISADIKEIPRYFGAPKRIFLQGADAFAADYDVLMKIAEAIHEEVPSVETIGGYARIDNFTEKTIDQLRNMKAIGFSAPYIGVESGDDAILKMVHKGYTAAEAREQLEKLDTAEWTYHVNFLNGVGGHNYGLSHAQKTAELYKGLHPALIDIASLTLIPNTILYRREQKGEFIEATEVERLEELKEFLRLLENETIFQAYHVSNPFSCQTKIPENKDKIMATLDSLINEVGEAQLSDYRHQIRMI